MAEPAPRNLKVLVIDDNVGMVETLRIILTRKDYDVVYAHTGEAGVELALDAQPDLILLDWMLPDSEGPDLLVRLKDACNAPCIMVTAKDTAENVVRALDAGCDDFVSKPVHPEVLLLRVGRIASRLCGAA
jgi:DNA-binding response OmpR family regulator